ncbi:G5 domain-containing protein, partial [Streptococcus suis]|nr:G5 domain-containing protein [Streptococcus suis]
YVGTETVKQEGQTGLKTVTYTDDEVTDTQVVTPSLPHIISRGTKPLPVVRTENEVIPFETIYEDDPSAYVGTETVKQEGQTGLK